ncbi:MAG: nitrilase-related carbon-nitrogen hydrolase [Chloroflexota bacterium]
MQPLRIALAQIAPRLGDLEANLARHHELIAAARERGAGLLVFPELGLTGYQLQDLAAEVAMRPDDPRLAALANAARGMSTVVSFVEESPDHRLFIAAAPRGRGDRASTARSSCRRTGSSMSAGSSRRATWCAPRRRSWVWAWGLRSARTSGTCPRRSCSRSTGRSSWDQRARRRGVHPPRPTRWGWGPRPPGARSCGHTRSSRRPSWSSAIAWAWTSRSVLGRLEVIGPTGAQVFGAPMFEEGLFTAEIELGDVRRERISLPLLRDERPELIGREWDRIVASRAGLAEEGQ